VPSRRRLLGMLGVLPLILAGCEEKPQITAMKVGERIPELDLPALDGHRFRIAPMKSPLLLNFWATWCPPCRAEMQSLERLHKAYAGQGLRVVGVSVDTDHYLVKEFVFQEHLSFPIVLDPGGAEARKGFEVTAYPTTYLIDRSGYLAEVWLGEQDWGREDIRKKISALV